MRVSAENSRFENDKFRLRGTERGDCPVPTPSAGGLSPHPYQNIYFPSDSAAGDFAGDIMAFPTTYVIDRSGAIVGEAMLGGIDNEDNMAALQKLIDQALANDSAK